MLTFPSSLVFRRRLEPSRPSRYLDISAAKQCEAVQCGQHQLILNQASISETLFQTKDNDDDVDMTTFQIIVMFNDALSTSQTWK
jgi:hypothetical protein